jgi:hypothetical protein
LLLLTFDVLEGKLMEAKEVSRQDRLSILIDLTTWSSEQDS